MFQKLLIAAVAITLTASVASAATLQLQPIPDAFARLGHSCSGISSRFSATASMSSATSQDMFALTRCGSSGRGAGYHTTTYSTWVAVTWSLSGVVIDEAASVPSPYPSIAGAYHSGSLGGGASYPTCNNTTPYDNAFSCVSVPVGNSTGTYSVQISLYISQAA
jgi:hypothetical protein